MDVNLVQNNTDSDGCKCINGDIVVDYNFYFIVVNGVLINGFVYFSKGKSEYALLSIDQFLNCVQNGLTCDGFSLNSLVLSQGGIVASAASTPTTLVESLFSLAATITPLGVITSLLFNGVTIPTTFYTLDGAGTTATFTAPFPSASNPVIPTGTTVVAVTAGVPPVTNVTFTVPVGSNVVFIPNPALTVSVATTPVEGIASTLGTVSTTLTDALEGFLVTSIAFIPAVTPGTLLRLIPFRDDDCNTNSYAVINESGINL